MCGSPMQDRLSGSPGTMTRSLTTCARAVSRLQPLWYSTSRHSATMTPSAFTSGLFPPCSKTPLTHKYSGRIWQILADLAWASWTQAKWGTLLGQGLQVLVAGSVPHFACVQEAQAKSARICQMRPEYLWVRGVLEQGGNRPLVKALGVIVALWREVEYQRGCSLETALAQVVNDRVIVPGDPLRRSCIGEPHIVLFGVLPPAVEDPVGVRLVELIVQPQTEARRNHAI